MDNYDEILNFYKDNKNSSDLSTELFFNNYSIKIMKDYSKNHNNNNLIIKNCLILLLNLFKIDAPDCYHDIGKIFEELSKKEKKRLIELLKSDF